MKKITAMLLSALLLLSAAAFGAGAPEAAGGTQEEAVVSGAQVESTPAAEKETKPINEVPMEETTPAEKMENAKTESIPAQNIESAAPVQRMEAAEVEESAPVAEEVEESAPSTGEVELAADVDLERYANKIKNPGAESDDMSGYSNFNATVERVQDNPKNGNYALKVTQNADAWNAICAKVALKANVKYAISAWYRRGEGNTYPDVKMCVEYKLGGANNQVIAFTQAVADDNWVKVSGTWIAEVDGEIDSTQLYMSTGGNAGPTVFYVDDWSIREIPDAATTMEAFTPAEGTQQVSVAEDIRLDYDFDLDKDTISAQSFSFNGQTLEGTVSFEDGDDSALTFTPKEPLAYDYAYSVTFNQGGGAKDCFGRDLAAAATSFSTCDRLSVEEAVYTLDGAPITALQAGTVGVQLSVKNTGEEAENAMLVLMVYQNGELEKVLLCPAVSVEVDGQATLTGEIEVSSPECTLRSGIWDEGFRPLTAELSFDKNEVGV